MIAMILLPMNCSELWRQQETDYCMRYEPDETLNIRLEKEDENGDVIDTMTFEFVKC